jgi:glycosyltransferase involved in cell wall biosynthesis
MRVAYFSPMPPVRSGIADYSTLLLPALRERVEELVVARPGKRAPRADVCLYHVGNDPEAHGWIVDELARRPGVVVLHEFVVHHLIAGMTIGRGNGRGYLDAMERELGVAGRLVGLGVLDNLLPLIWETQPDRFPLAGTVLDLALEGLIVHSRFVEARAREAHYEGPIWRVPHPAWPDERLEPADVHGAPLIGCFGHQNMNKRIPQLLEAFTLLRRRRPGARLLLVGVATERFDLERRLERLGIGGEALIREGYVSEQRLTSLMAACDVLVNLRSPTMGETSGSVIRALSLGKALIVSDVGWFSELPDSAVLKVPVDEFEVPTIAAALELAAEHGRELGEAARAYVLAEHDLGRVADAYVAALEEAAGGGAVRDALLWRIAEAASEAGLEDISGLARRAREAGIV